MAELKEIIIEKLAVVRPESRIDFLIERLNRTINPPKPATADNVNIRVMYIVNDRVNSHGGRFRRADLLRLSRLIIDTPVLIGHNRAAEPLARNFHAELEDRDGALWLKSYFYWPRVPEGQHNSLTEKIDSGVLKECSISFTYTFPECSECGQDIRSCRHLAADVGSGPDHARVHFIYNGITQVLETSLVYKGSVKGTFLSDKLANDPSRAITIISNNKRIRLSFDLHPRRKGRIGIVNIGLPSASAHILRESLNDVRAALAAYNDRAFLLIESTNEYGA